MEIKRKSVGGSPSAINDKFIGLIEEGFVFLFKETVQALIDNGELDQKDATKTLTHDAALIGAYTGLLRVFSLDGIIPPDDAMKELNRMLTALIASARIAHTEEEVEKHIEELTRMNAAKKTG